MEPQIHHASVHADHICSIIQDQLQFDQKDKRFDLPISPLIFVLAFRARSYSLFSPQFISLQAIDEHMEPHLPTSLNSLLRSLYFLS